MKNTQNGKGVDVLMERLETKRGEIGRIPFFSLAV